MQAMVIEASAYTPKVVVDFEGSLIEITGKSYPENSVEFYAGIKTAIEKMAKLGRDIRVKLELSYINSASFRAITEIFEILRRAKQDGAYCDVAWFYSGENELSKETGEDFLEEFDDLDIKLFQKES